MKKNDFKLLLFILVAAIAVFAGYQLFYQSSGDSVTITVDGKIYQTLPLNQDTELNIPGTNGGTNHLKIQNGAASITDADCPDKLCVHQKKISRNGESLVCLPHKVIVTVESKKDSQLDGIAQ